MKNKLKRVIAICLIVLMLVPTAVMSVSATGEGVYDPTEEEIKELGASFDSGTTAKMEKILPSLPYTYEAEVQLNSSIRGGVILGNYQGNGKCISFEIHENGRPRLYVANGGNATSIIFDKVSILSESLVRVAITVDATNNMAHCYVNGELRQSLSFNYNVISNTIPTDRPLMVGGDYRNGNSTPFLGQIKSVYAYSDMRTSEEIAQGSSLTDESLLVAYEFMSSGGKNLSSYEGYDLVMSDWKMAIADENALTFSPDNTYQVMKAFDAPILTYEAEVYFPKTNDNSTRGGVVLGNYYSGWGSSCVNFEFKEKGTPRLYFECNGTQFDFHFNQIDARQDKFVFVTITLDPATGEAKCYIDGELKQTITKDGFTIPDAVYSNAMYLGRDSRGASGYPFKGAIKSLAVYSDVRTADEIKADMNEFDKNSENLLAMYEFSKDTGRSDISGNCYHICYNGEARPEETPSPDAPSMPDVPNEISGIEFTGNDYAIIGKDFPIDSDTYTFEAFIHLPTNVTDRGGVILGNFKDGGNHYFNFEIYNNGVPRIAGTYSSNVGTTYDYQFNSVDVRGDKPVHLTITLDKTTGVANCYLNGEFKQSKTQSLVTVNEQILDNRMIIGNDLRSGTKRNFLGTIGAVAVYTDIRTVEEIVNDAWEIDLESDNLEMYFNLAGLETGDDIEDLTGNGYNAKFGTRTQAEKSDWIYDKAEVTDYLYSFAVVGDTQMIARYYPTRFSEIYDWILANQRAKKIGYVFGLGDITEDNASSEWVLAKDHILDKLTGVIPYSVVRGNHDGVSNINGVFATEEYMSQFDGFYKENDITNSYRFFTIAETDYLLITLDYGASDSVLSWAGDIIGANPDKKVIITTHAYLYRDGTTLDKGDVCPPSTSGGYNNGDHMWDKLISKYENIYLVMSGHDPSANVVVTQAEGVNGNIVTQILTDHQGIDTSTPTGMVTMLYFKADGSIEVETYSPLQNAYYKEANQLVIEETEHIFTENKVYDYADGYLMPGTFTADCINCGKSHTVKTEAMITFKGYSVKNDRTAVCVGYSINYKLLNAYEQATGKDLILGAVSCASDNLINKDNKPIKADGTTAEVTIGNVISSEIEVEYTNVAIIVETDNWSKYADKPMILCAYILENEEVSYICSKYEASESATTITYNEIIAKIDSGGDEE